MSRRLTIAFPGRRDPIDLLVGLATRPARSERVTLVPTPAGLKVTIEPVRDPTAGE